ncbi:uncharacterized protein si:ch211-199g17.2 [Centropristis striata]|uniref:uncharacterized protein si:ch211-199g17.2 n=1 Tax=Centropristis striata TaxID=184440 RepID=UPI0027DEDE0B|nr:uncharacterized protein si:ch211-199g17.2 [Centropristis striata]XP_059205713.1 uncharacterized protein si:ch211-199g17.2 [Centropristis striata]
MQPAEAQKGVPSKSQLFNSLKNFLNIKNRLQPIIGLGSITECVRAGTHNREVLYLCEVCVCRLHDVTDMRNHILGSLHRYNYIKVWHSHLVSKWKKSDLSNLARPLMEMAKILEGKEGPGDVQRLEVGDAVYQKTATLSENDAVTLITMLRDGQGEPVQLEQSQRIVLLARNQQTLSKNSLKTSSDANQTVTFIKPESWEKNTSSEPCVLSENGFLDGYTGTRPLIGLFRMVECRGEDGQTYCFLCHCCRIRSSKKDLFNHLTGSSHLMNYLMETRPEQVEIMMADINDNNELLQSLAKKVEQEEGRGMPTVVNVPGSLCFLLTVKSYHWCIKMLYDEGTHTNIQKSSSAKGPSESETLHQNMPEKCAMMQPQWAKRMTAKRKKRKDTNTVFKVSLPLSKGSMLLKRMSFSMDSLPVSSASDSDPIPSPESQSEDCDLDYDPDSFAMNRAEHTSQVQKDLYSGDENAGQNWGPERNVTVHQYQEVDDYYKENKYFKQSEDITATKYQKVYDDDDDDDYSSSQERSHERFYKEWKNEGPQTQNECLSPALSHSQDWPSLNSSYRLEWYNSTSTVSKENQQNERSSGESQYYYQRQNPSHYTAQDESLETGNEGKHGQYNEFAAHSDVAKINMHHHLGYPLAHSGSIAPEPREKSVIEQRQLQTYMEFPIGYCQTVSQGYMTQPVAHQTIPVGQWMMSNPSYNIGPLTYPHQHFPHPVSDGAGGWAHVPVNWFQHRQALSYGAHSNSMSDVMISGSSH